MGKNSASLVNKRSAKLTDSTLLLIIAISIFAVLYIGAFLIFGGSFARVQGFFDLFNNNAALFILACALSIVMVAGSIDISVGGVVALVTAACAIFLDSGSGNVFTSILMALGIGLTFGLVQGFLVAYMKVQSFIITLAGMFFARGMATVITVNSHTVANESFLALKNIKLEIGFLGYVAPRSGNLIPATIDLGVFIALIVIAVIAAVLKWTRWGRNLYAVGGNTQSALTLGIDVRRTIFISHVLCGLLAGIAGYIFLMKAGSGYAQHAMAFEMKAIAASIIGGTMLTGGVGNIIGSPIGVMVLMTIETIVRASGITSGGRIWLQDVTTGAMLFLALLLQSVILTRSGGKFKWAIPKWLRVRSGSESEENMEMVNQETENEDIENKENKEDKKT